MGRAHASEETHDGIAVFVFEAVRHMKTTRGGRRRGNAGPAAGSLENRQVLDEFTCWNLHSSAAP
jgi:hypothetical protein